MATVPSTKTRMGRRWHAATIVAAAAIVAVLAPTGTAGASTTPATPEFAERMVVPITNPKRLVLADVNGDDRSDLIITSGTSTVHLAVLLATATRGTYTTSSDVTFGLSHNLGKPVVADLDGDGALDLFVGLGSDGHAWQLGAGDGTFGPVQTSTVPITTAAVGDLVGSVDPDLVGISGGTATIFAGDGTGAFADTGTPLSTGGLLQGLATGNIDGVGRDEVAITAYQGNPLDPNVPTVLSIQRAVGDGTFTADDHPLINIAGGIDFGDLDGDGYLDVAAASTAAKANLAVALGKPDGTVTTPNVIQTATSPSSVDIADVDDDGNGDVISDEVGAMISFGRGDGTFDPIVGYRGGFGAVDAQAGDLDGDGIVDIADIGATRTPTPAGVSLLFGEGEGRFTGIPTAKWATTDRIAVGDVTGDGRPDYLQALLRSGEQAELLRNDGSGRLEPSRGISLPSVPTAIAVGRVGSDPLGDLVGTTATGIVVSRSNGDGTFATATSYPTGTPVADPPPPVVTDFDRDGSGDVAVADGASKIWVLMGNGPATLATAVSHPAGGTATHVVSADVNGDGDPDLITTTATGPSLDVLLGNGDGGFSAPIVRSLSAPAVGLVAADLDGDARVDVVVATGTGSSTSIRPYLGVGDGTFADALPVTPTESPTSGSRSIVSFTAGDFNGDGLDDVALDGVRFTLADCSGRLIAATSAPDQYDRSLETVAADMDGDGRTDLVGRTINGNAAVRLSRAPDVAPGRPAAPFSSCRSLVDQAYRDLLQRPPTSTERAAASTALADGTLMRGALFTQLRRSADHLANVDPIVRLYRAYFLRNPDPSGLDHWVAKRRGGATLSSISNQFARSSEFKRRYGSLTNAAFVDLVYRNVLDRPGESGGVAYWTSQLDRKRKSRGQVMLNFSDSNEYTTKQANEVDVAVLRTWMLRTVPAGPVFAADVAALDGGAPLDQIAAEILDLPTYAVRVGAE